MNTFPIHLSDFYKVSHKNQYPDGTEAIYSNLTARSSRMDGVDHVVFFGLQYFVKRYLQEEFNKGFFWLSPTVFTQKLNNYKKRLDNALGGDNDVSHWRKLWELEYLPLEIKALTEGALVPLRVPLLTVKNTLPEFFWLGQWMETLLSNVIWQPITTATIAYQYRKLFDEFNRETSDLVDFVPVQGHDFSMRGHSSVDSSSVGGAGHLLSFIGTDTIPAIDFLETYYNANSDKEVVGVSVPATEHSTMTVNGEDGEFEIIRRLITEIYPSGIVSIVSDSYNLWRVLTDYLPRLKDEILGRNGKIVIRPDSGDPVDIICGRKRQFILTDCYNPADDGVIQLLWNVFGGTTNSKGYRQLDDHVGCIYGDSITLDRAKAILDGLKANRFSSSNIVCGIGSFTYQYVTRDTFGLAFKATAIKSEGVWRAIYKDPITDNGMKKSARGLLAVLRPYTTGGFSGSPQAGSMGDYHLKEDVSEEIEASAWNCLQPVFRDGVLLKEFTLGDIRKRLVGQ